MTDCLIVGVDDIDFPAYVDTVRSHGEREKLQRGDVRTLCVSVEPILEVIEFVREFAPAARSAGGGPERPRRGRGVSILRSRRLAHAR